MNVSGGFARYENFAAQDHYLLAALIEPARLDVDYAAIALRLRRNRLEHGRLRIQRVTGEGRTGMPHRFVLEVRDRILAHVLHAHADHRRHHEQPVDERPSMLRGGSVGGVEMERVGVHRHQREPGVVEVRDGAAGPMLENLAGVEILEIAIHESAILSRELYDRR